jgi:hypothetical protein
MRLVLKSLAIFCVSAGLAFSGTVSVRMGGNIALPTNGDTPPEPILSLGPTFLITYDINELPTPAFSGSGFTSINVMATLESGTTKYTKAAQAAYFAYDSGYTGIDVRFWDTSLQFILVFFAFDSAFAPPEASPKILVTNKTGLSGSVSTLSGPFMILPVSEGFYEATRAGGPEIPEPGTMALLAGGVVALAVFRRRFGQSR